MLAGAERAGEFRAPSLGLRGERVPKLTGVGRKNMYM